MESFYSSYSGDDNAFDKAITLKDLPAILDTLNVLQKRVESKQAERKAKREEERKKRNRVLGNAGCERSSAKGRAIRTPSAFSDEAVGEMLT